MIKVYESLDANTIIIDYNPKNLSTIKLRFNKSSNSNVSLVKKLLNKFEKNGMIDGFLSSLGNFEIMNYDQNLLIDELISELSEIYPNIIDQYGRQLN